MAKHKRPKKPTDFWQKYRAFLLISFSCLLFISLLIGINTRTTQFITISTAQEIKETPTLTPPDVREVLGITAESTKSATLRIPILMYHYIEHVQDPNDTFREMLNIHPELFDEQIKTLKDAGYTFMTMKEVGEVLDGIGVLPPKPVVLTFDDGYRDFATDAMPIMKKYQAKGTIYVISGMVTNPDHMSKEQLEEVMKTGLVDVGAHTIHHAYLKGSNEETATTEIAGSKMMLEFLLGVPIVSFAYPFGTYDDQAERITAEAGFTTGVTTTPGIEVKKDNRYILDRLRPGFRVGSTLTNYLEGDHFEAFE
jgi:peptidoglycan/xylan/chitin deacetylase (PgdA/CDA1 family)